MTWTANGYKDRRVSHCQARFLCHTASLNPPCVMWPWGCIGWKKICSAWVHESPEDSQMIHREYIHNHGYTGDIPISKSYKHGYPHLWQWWAIRLCSQNTPCGPSIAPAKPGIGRIFAAFGTSTGLVLKMWDRSSPWPRHKKNGHPWIHEMIFKEQMWK